MCVCVCGGGGGGGSMSTSWDQTSIVHLFLHRIQCHAIMYYITHINCALSSLYGNKRSVYKTNDLQCRVGG